MRFRRPQVIQIATGLLVLTIGVLVYLLDRPSTSVYLVPDSWTFGRQFPSVFGLIGQQLPTFAHTFAFSLFTCAVLEPWRGAAPAACTGWWVFGSLFELAQRDAWSAVIAAWVPAWFADWPVLDNVTNYFVNGRYDPRDMVSIALAAICAWGVIVLTHRLRPAASG